MVVGAAAFVGTQQNASISERGAQRAATPRATPTDDPAGAERTPATARSPFTAAPYQGLGAWVDVYDWSRGYDRTPEDPPSIGVDEVAALADHGVQTLFLQAARFDASSPGALEPGRVRRLIDAAHDAGLDVVAWYLPTLEDPVGDLARIEAITDLPVDGLALDIESTRVPDEAERNQRMVALAAQVRADHPGDVLGAIVLPPVVTEVYGTYWPGYPWAELAPHFDVWQPMAYWTQRQTDSGWRDAHRYTAMNVALLRGLTGRPDAVVHPIGGIGCCEGPTAPTTTDDVAAFLRAASEAGAVGASLYDVVTTGPELWPALAGANDLG